LLGAKNPDTGQPMSDEQVVDNLLTFLLAGHEPTAKALTWALYLVARRPAWEERRQQEMLRVAGMSRSSRSTLIASPRSPSL
jgi:cytochrome P450